MTLDLLVIAVLFAASLGYAALIRGRGRLWALFVGSIIGIYWLQPSLPTRFSAYALQTVTLILTFAAWWLTRPSDDEKGRRWARDDRLGALLMLALVLLMALNRFVASDIRLVERPPSLLIILPLLVMVMALMWFAGVLTRRLKQKQVLSWAILAVIVLFVLLKLNPLAVASAAAWRAMVGQDVSLAAPVDLAWLGFSYVAFRLIHTMRDRQTGILPALSLPEYVTYVIFAPSYIAGPIDRAERFVEDLRRLPAMIGLDAGRFLEGSRRIAIGLFKKFVIADLLAQGMSLTAVNAAQAESTIGLWILLYGYAFRLYFDFSGYTDIAIGLAILFGIRLPENFDRPYLSTNITVFWQRWHITLSNWVRFYVFSPLSRMLLRRKPRPPLTLIVLVSQLATMIVIGLWHGITLNFLIWGIWHGLGLFAHKQWSDRTRKWYRNLQQTIWPRRTWSFFTWFLTFQFVVLGWVWFLLPTTELALETFARLFSIGA